MTAGGGAFGLTVTLSDRLSLSEFPSLSWTVKLLVPVELAVPEITPELGFSISPAGNLPETIDQVNGSLPFVPVRMSPKICPCTASRNDVVVIEGGGLRSGATMNVATVAVQFVGALRLSRPAYWPVLFKAATSVAARDVPVSCASSVEPQPSLTTPG